MQLTILPDNLTDYFIEHCEIDYFVLGKNQCYVMGMKI